MEWKAINGFEDLYKVSSDGQVFSIKSNRNLKPCKTPDGYLFHRLYKDRKVSIFREHRLVAIAFIPNTENKPQVNHKNGIKTDNSIENLEWVDQFENMQHALNNGLFPRRDGKFNSRAKIVVNLETGICFDTAKEAAIAHGIPATTLRGYLNGTNTNYSSMVYA
jgi:hypothetical protein